MHQHLPRLAPEHYRGFAAVHWSMTVNKRRTGWLSPAFHARCRELVLHAAVQYNLLCPAYCLMPDHIHILFRGVARGADQRLAVSFLRRHLNIEMAPCQLQREPYDHVLRRKDLEREAFRAVACYIADNPVRAGMARVAADYPYSGAVLPGRPHADLHHPKFWDVFWEMHERLLCANGYEG